MSQRPADNYGAEVTIGIEDGNGTAGVQITYNREMSTLEVPLACHTPAGP